MKNDEMTRVFQLPRRNKYNIGEVCDDMSGISLSYSIANRLINHQSQNTHNTDTHSSFALINIK